MNYGYIRTESQRLEIGEFATQNGIAIDQWTKNTDIATEGDIVIASELSQLASDPLQALELLKHLLNAGAQIWTAKEGYKLGGDASSKILAFAFGISADIKRRIISEHTREALACVKADGKKLGRPLGRRNSMSKLAGHANEIRRLLSSGCSRAEVARRLGVHRDTLSVFLRDLLYSI